MSPWEWVGGPASGARNPWRKGTNTWAGLLGMPSSPNPGGGRGPSWQKKQPVQRHRSQSRCCGVWLVAQAEPREGARSAWVGGRSCGLVKEHGCWLESRGRVLRGSVLSHSDVLEQASSDSMGMTSQRWGRRGQADGSIVMSCTVEHLKDLLLLLLLLLTEPVKFRMYTCGCLPEKVGFLKMMRLCLEPSIGSDLLRSPYHWRGDFVQQVWPLPVA